MRVLWVCNIMLPVIAEQLGLSYSNKEGWLTGLSERLLDEKTDEIVLGVCFPWQTPIEGKLQNRELYYYGFCEDVVHEERYDENLENSMKRIIDLFCPDIIHCFGTEYGHTYAAVKAFGKPEHTLVGLQGICSSCAEHYLDGIPAGIARHLTFRDLVRRDNLRMQQKKMEKRGERENKILQMTGNVTGRTHYDRTAAENENPGVHYYFMNETMRSNFYGPVWDRKACRRHSIFMSQGNYPVKGLHYMLRALPALKEKYPDVHLYVAGDRIVKEKLLQRLIKQSSYGKYIHDLIKAGKLEDTVTFLGPLNAEQMCGQYLKCHVFASVSTIENSPNSVGEAMLLGVPVVSSLVGGVPDMLRNEEEGLLYPAGDLDGLVRAVGRIFDQDALAGHFSAAARMHAVKTHDKDANFNRLLEIYHDINIHQ